MKSLKKISLIALGCAVVSIIAVGQGVTPASTISEADLENFAQNNSPYYEPCGTVSTLTGEITIAGNSAEEKVWSGLASFLTAEQAAGIMGNIAQEDGNYNPVRREAGQGGNLYNKGTQMGLGLIQWSFGRRVNLLNYIKEKDSSLIKYFEDDSNAQLTGDDFIKKVGDDVANKIYQLEIQFLKDELDKSYKEYYNQSNIDEATVWFRAKVERAGVFSDSYRKKKAREAFEKYSGRTITDSGSTTGSGSGVSCDANVQGSKNINGAAVALAWPYGTGSTQYDYPDGSATDAFKKAIDEVYPNRGWSHCPKIGASCDVFVGTVVRWSGYDPDFPRGLDEQIPYVSKHSDLWEAISWSGEKSDLQGGDIIHTSGHTYIIVQDGNGQIWIAEAGLCRVFGHIMKYESGHHHSGTIIRAKNANNATTGISVTDGAKTSSTSGAISNTNQGNHDIGASAIALAWPAGKEAESKKSGTDAFNRYYDAMPGAAKDSVGGKSCDRFVATVVRYSGLDDNIPLSLRDMQPYLEQSSDWEEVQTSDDGNAESNYQPGDVVFYYRNTGWDDRVYKGKKLAHVGIYAKDASGNGHIVAASHGVHYGIVQDFRGTSSFNPVIRIYRNKNNQNGSAECDVCAMADDKMGLVEGGLSKEQAEKLMAIYKTYAGANNLHGDTAIAKKYYIKVGCHGNLFLNCPSFVKYFVNRYTTKQWKTGITGNGNTVAKKLASDLGLETGSEPRPYAVFSDDSYSPGHTGVVLSVDKAKGTMIVGEAGCMSSSSTKAAYDFIGAHELPIDKYHIYAYLDPIINLSGV